VDSGENGWRLRLSRSVFSQKLFSCDVSQTGTYIDDPSNENVHAMKENNIFKYRSHPMVEGGVTVTDMNYSLFVYFLVLLNNHSKQ
jgi:hypothetical protein